MFNIMDKKANISQKVKQLLSSIKWDYEKGTVQSLDILKVISKDKTLNLLIESNDLRDLKQKTLSIEALLNQSQLEAKDFNSPLIETPHLLMAVVKFLSNKKYRQIKGQLNQLLNQMPMGNSKKDLSTHSILQKSKKEFEKTIHNDSYSLPPFLRDINYLSKKNLLAKPIPNKSLEEEIISVIGRKHKNSIVILGPKGSGKTSTLLSLAHRITKGDVPKFLSDSKIFYVNLGGFSHMLDFKEKFESLFKKIIYSPTKKHQFIIFLLDDLHLLSQSGFFSFSPPLLDPLLGSKASAKLQPLPKVTFIATLDDTLSDRFLEGPIQDYWELIRLLPPKRERLLKILNQKVLDLQKHHDLRIYKPTLGYLATALPKLAKELDLPLIGFSVNLVDDLFSKFSLEQSLNKKVKKTKFVPKSFVQEYLKNRYNYNPQKNFSDSIISRLMYLEDNIKNEIIGQNHAIESLVRTIKRSVLGLSNTNKPKASVLFLGPTGVGKTQTAKVLAKHLFGKKKIIRIDMSDFMEKHTVSRLVGSPPGYVGYGEGGQLTNFVKKNPQSVVLFDEIEKAHTDVLNILLQILEEGQLTDGEGNVISFNQAVIVLTSNLGAELINKDPIGFMNKKGYDITYQNVKERLLENLKKKIKPEIINRLNEIVVYKQLTKNDASLILQKELSVLKQKVLEKHNIYLIINPKVTQFILKKGFSKEYGVRELQRSLDRNLTDPIIDFILQKYSLKKPKEAMKVYVKKSKKGDIILQS